MDLYKLRTEKNLTMRCISETIGISEGYYCLLENGRRRPSVNLAKRLGAALGVDWTLFFEDGDADNEQPPTVPGA